MSDADGMRGAGPATGGRRTAAYRDLYGPTAIVTGASDGIGEAFARALAARGLDLVLVARRRERLDVLAAALAAEHGVAVRVLPVDLGRPGAAARVLEYIERDEIGLLVAAAGFGTAGDFLAQPLAPELDMIEVNCRAVVELAHAVGRRLADRGRGGIVLLSSIVAFQGVPRSATYAATKAFVQTFAEGLHAELRPRGVDVIAAAPGPVASGFGARAGMRMGRAAAPTSVAAATLDALGRTVTVRPGPLSKALGYALMPLPRWGRIRIMAQIMRGMTEGRPGPVADPARPRPGG